MDASTATLAYAFPLLCVAVPLATAALADGELKKLLEQVNVAYIEAFNRQDAAGAAAQFATGGVIVNPTGLKTDIPAHLEGIFKTGIRRAEGAVEQAWALGTGTALGMGRFRTAGKDGSGAAIGVEGFWTATYVQEGGQWKLRMLTTLRQAPPGT